MKKRLIDEIPVQSKPIYRFRLDTETGEIEKIKITKYELVTVKFDGQSYYRYRGVGQWNHIKLCNLDKMFVNQVYSFNGSIKNARDIFARTLLEKANNLYDEYEKVCNLYAKIQ